MMSAAETATANLKVKPSTRDRANAAAKVAGVTPGVLIERLVAGWEREQRLESVRAAYAALPREDREAYRRESAEWESIQGLWDE